MAGEIKPYNGFTSEERTASLPWFRKGYATGYLVRPTRCEACDQTRGIIDHHAEDYSQPYGPHIYAYALCYVCHLMLHCRRGRGQAGWNRYRALVAAGFQHDPVSHRGFGTIQRLLNGHEECMRPPATPRAPVRTVLDDIHDGILRLAPGNRWDGERVIVDPNRVAEPPPGLPLFEAAGLPPT